MCDPFKFFHDPLAGCDPAVEKHCPKVPITLDFCRDLNLDISKNDISTIWKRASRCVETSRSRSRLLSTVETPKPTNTVSQLKEKQSSNTVCVEIILEEWEVVKKWIPKLKQMSFSKVKNSDESVKSFCCWQFKMTITSKHSKSWRQRPESRDKRKQKNYLDL